MQASLARRHEREPARLPIGAVAVLAVGLVAVATVEAELSHGLELLTAVAPLLLTHVARSYSRHQSSSTTAGHSVLPQLSTTVGWSRWQEPIGIRGGRGARNLQVPHRGCCANGIETLSVY